MGEKGEERSGTEIGDDEGDRSAEAHPAVIEPETAHAGQRQRLGDRQGEVPQAERNARDDQDRPVTGCRPGKQEDQGCRHDEHQDGEAAIGRAVGESPGKGRERDPQRTDRARCNWRSRCRSAHAPRAIPERREPRRRRIRNNRRRTPACGAQTAAEPRPRPCWRSSLRIDTS